MLTQKGYLGGTGPIFEDDAAPGGLKYLLYGSASNGVMQLHVASPNLATNLNAGYSPSDYTLGSYAEGQVTGNAPAYVQPATGPGFSGYLAKQSDWVTATTTVGNTPTTTTPTTTTTTTGTTTPTTTTTTGTTYSAASIGEQLSTFASNYWWAGLILLGIIFWKPISNAIGLGGKKRRR